MSYETVSHLLKEVGKVDLGAKRLRELDVRRNTGGVCGFGEEGVVEMRPKREVQI